MTKDALRLSNHARAEEIERLPMEEGEAGDEPAADDEDDRSEREQALDRERLGSRENFWGN